MGEVGAWSSAQRHILRALISDDPNIPATTPLGAAFFAPLLNQLQQLIPADQVVAVLLNSGERSVRHVYAADHEIRVPSLPAFHAAFWNIAWTPAAGIEPTPEQLRIYPPIATFDAYFPAQLRHVRLHGILGAKLTDVFAMFVSIPVSVEIQLRLMFFRGTSGFTPAETLTLDLLGPHLLARCRRVVASIAQRSLTARQRTVLRLAALGCSRAEIAEHLQLSPGTVRKHFDNIYGRLGVSNKISAVQRAFPSGIAAPQVSLGHFD